MAVETESQIGEDLTGEEIAALIKAGTLGEQNEAQANQGQSQGDQGQSQTQTTQPPAEEKVEGEDQAESGADKAAADQAAEETAKTAKAWYDEEEEAEKAAATQTTQQTSQATQKDPTYEKYAPLLNRPDVKFILDQAAAGVSIFDIQKQITILDFEKMSPAEIYEHDLKVNGYTPEEIVEEMGEFATKKVGEQNRLTNPLRSMYNGKQEQKMASLNQATQANAELQRNIALKAEQDLKQTITEMKGTKFMDYEVTDNVMNKAVERVLNGYPELTNSDGSPNIRKQIEYAIAIDNAKGIVRTNVRNAKSNGGREVAKEVTNGSKNMQGQQTGLNTALSLEEAVENMMKRDENQ